MEKGNTSASEPAVPTLRPSPVPGSASQPNALESTATEIGATETVVPVLERTITTEMPEHLIQTDEDGDDPTEEGKRGTRSVPVREEVETDAETQRGMKRLKDPLYRQAKRNLWYQWASYTGRTTAKEDCYVCSRARESILLVTNTQYSWKNCENTKSEWIQYMSGPQSKFEIDVELDLSPLCEAECIQMLGSKEYYNSTLMNGLVYIDLKDLKSPIKKVGDRCAMLDVRVEKDLRPVPSGTELEIVGTFECFEKEGSRDVGKLRRSLCDTIWELTPKRNGGCVPSEPNSRRESALALKKGNQTRPAPKVCPYHYATQAVADQFWLCGGEILLSALPLDWHGRCARVQAIQPVVIIPGREVEAPSGSRTR
ncbi:hypothetical protein D5F01_LYC13242 [Larimichthys crocea]|uniref:Uncharacterized protein n=1 Tax=Larimichthys crocea TaxID=215358 RepID=A0A6G0IDG7_LARCR|nr:hypothetical protein D5F01_LYC13242 [Larimichthys crocea]